jgi:hypothetical protein
MKEMDGGRYIILYMMGLRWAHESFKTGLVSRAHEVAKWAENAYKLQV